VCECVTAKNPIPTGIYLENLLCINVINAENYFSILLVSNMHMTTECRLRLANTQKV